MRWRASGSSLQCVLGKAVHVLDDALRVNNSLQGSGKAPGIGDTIAALKCCGRSRDIRRGRRIHRELLADRGRKSVVEVDNALIDMYFKCGKFREARQIFQEMQVKSVVSWTSMILGSVEFGDPELALDFFAQMQEHGILADARSYVAALKACSKMKSHHTDLVNTAKALHNQVLRAGYESDVFVGSSLVNLYVKLGNLVEACQVFDRMEKCDIASWNAIIAGHAKLREGEVALELFQGALDQPDLKPNGRTYVAAIGACSSWAAVEDGTLVDGKVVKAVSLAKASTIHRMIEREGIELELVVGTSLVDLYVKCGSVENARKVFDRMVETNTVSWTSMISGYTQYDQGEVSLQLFEAMQEKGILPDARTFVAALKACSNCAEKLADDDRDKRKQLLHKCQSIHLQLKKYGHDTDLFVACTLVDLYTKLGSMVDAQQVFDGVARRDVVLWNSMIAGATQCGEPEQALELFKRMRDENLTLTSRSYVAVLSACTSLFTRSVTDVDADQQKIRMLCFTTSIDIHQQLRNSGFEMDNFVASSLVEMYSAGGSMSDARAIFDSMASKDLVSWNSIIKGYSQNGEGERALKLFKAMLSDGVKPNARTYVAVLNACASLAKIELGKPAEQQNFPIEKGRSIHSQILANSDLEEVDVVVGSALVDMYSKCRSMVKAQGVFERRPKHNVVSWTAVIFGHAQNDGEKLALELFQLMQDEGLVPNALTYSAALRACSSLANSEKVHGGLSSRVASLHSEVVNSGYESDILVASGLVDAYGKLGKFDEAEQVFSRMPQQCLVAWNSLIAGYTRNGKNELALQCFSRMQDQGLKPDAQTFSEALKACGNLGALEAGRGIHHQIQALGLDRNIRIASSLITFYGRCGSMEEAHEVFESAKRDLAIWSSLMSVYRNHGDSKKVVDLFERMQNEEPVKPDGVVFQHVLAALSHDGQVDKAKQCFRSMILDHGIVPDGEHYACLVDVLGRANQLQEALAMVEEIGVEPNLVVWNTILSGCSKWRNDQVARFALDALEHHQRAVDYITVASSLISP